MFFFFWGGGGFFLIFHMFQCWLKVDPPLIKYDNINPEISCSEKIFPLINSEDQYQPKSIFSSV